ncbi:uncharacterized protein LOC131853183 [Achroia grisella]|uniref:uncharacterized protein LOC131853183 n=1 Tax=Achroia grisella TaxID=688607 RepID=UPI0027D31A63|nr:uncharacterized protein LOC131853183 [Achroia grisella]
MACVENIPPRNVDSEMEEGEIIDELDDLSDISSDEEFLLRQRLHVLETYNNVLERKKANSISVASELEETSPQLLNTNRQIKTCTKEKGKKELTPLRISARNKDYKKKGRRKKKLQTKIISDTSEESDDEYRNKRRKLADAVSVHKIKNDTSLSSRLKKMLYKSQDLVETIDPTSDNSKAVEADNLINSPILDESYKSNNLISEAEKFVKNAVEICELIDLSNDDDVKSYNDQKQTQDTVDSGIIDKNGENIVGDSDEDLELLRQDALKTKSSKIKVSQPQIEPENKLLSEDDDTYTAELRLICLKSTYLKKAIELKRKQKLKKRLSQSSILHDEFINGEDILSNQIDSQNNTDIDSVDMDIGSDGDEKIKELDNVSAKINTVNEAIINGNYDKHITMKPKDDELEDDEDLLRAKLLTSLSKNLPKLIDPNVINTIKEDTDEKQPVLTDKKQMTKISEQKRFIIKLGDSDSEGEHEATKNLTKMHIKQQQSDFNQQLDMFLKFTRMQVENKENPNTLPAETIKPAEKFVAKSVKHLPKSEQIEYKNLVKKMAELEKIKKARQSAMNLLNKQQIVSKQSLRPHNDSMEPIKKSNDMDEQIAISRKKIADESSNMLRLKEEATKLSQKYKIAATELRNITTAITLNKKQQKSAQNRLSKIRLQHLALLKSSNFKHSRKNNAVQIIQANNENNNTNKVQKENYTTEEEQKHLQSLKSVKASVANDMKDDIFAPRLSIQVDITKNKKVVRMPKSPVKDTNNVTSTFDSETTNISHQNMSNESECKNADKSIQRRNSREIINDTDGSRKSGDKSIQRRNSKEIINDNDFSRKSADKNIQRRNSKEIMNDTDFSRKSAEKNIQRRNSKEIMNDTDCSCKICDKTIQRRNSKEIMNDTDFSRTTADKNIQRKNSKEISNDTDFSHKSADKNMQRRNSKEIMNDTDCSCKICEKSIQRRNSKEILIDTDCTRKNADKIIQRRNSVEIVNDTIQVLKWKKKDADDYKSPLEALDARNWKEDPNAFLCPFEVGGSCKDPDCKYLHLNTQ